MQIHTAPLDGKYHPCNLIPYLFAIPISALLVASSLFSVPGYVYEALPSTPVPVSPSTPIIPSGLSAVLQPAPMSSGFLALSAVEAVEQTGAEFQELEKFIAQVSDGESGTVRGVYLAGGFALPIIQQPEDKPAYVSNRTGLVTQFNAPSNYGVTGLLAHNYLAGEEFYKLRTGQEVALIYGDSLIKRYQVARIDTFQKLTPSRLKSDYLELSTGRRLSTSQMFKRFYRGDEHLTFQTCLEKDGLLNWGLLLVTAVPVDS